MGRMSFHVRSRSSKGSRVGLSIFLLIFAAVGTLFFVLGIKQTLDAMAMRRWIVTPCTIESSAARHDDAAHRHIFEVRYSYLFGGVEPLTSTVYQPDYDGDADASDAQRLVYRYAAGQQATCYVNPAAPEQATLQLPGYEAIGFALFALPFMAIGYGGAFLVWRRKAADGSAAAISSTTKSSKGGHRIGVAFFGIFAIVGGGLLWPLLIKPVTRIRAAASWPEVPCTVLASEVREHSDDDGTTYSVDILYEYAYAGQKYQSNRYEFMGGSSSGYKAKQAVVNQHPPGSQHVCYVNPDDPFEAVLQRGWSWMMMLGLIPAVFLLVGVGGMLGTLRSMRKRSLSRDSLAVTPLASVVPTAAVARVDVVDADWLPRLNRDQPAVMQAKRSASIGAAVFLLIFAAVWNGLVWTLLVPEVLSGWRSGSSGFGIIGAVLFTLFGSVFVLAGAAVAGAFVYAVLKSFNPLPRVTLSAAVAPLGGTLDVQWELLGRAERVRHLTVTLEGAERATYRRGTDTTTDEHVFATLPISDADVDRGGALHGRASITVPAQTMHSFKSSNNQVCWRLRVRGKIRLWPDVNETFDIAVVPAAMSRSGG